MLFLTFLIIYQEVLGLEISIACGRVSLQLGLPVSLMLDLSCPVHAPFLCIMVSEIGRLLPLVLIFRAVFKIDHFIVLFVAA
mmetsp:Transcript_724/g.668  ORF Transcript_724/g.668 Transcript_724/m.668 type:complete len:82 (-) Transcript_724:39-284(-)